MPIKDQKNQTDAEAKLPFIRGETHKSKIDDYFLTLANPCYKTFEVRAIRQRYEWTDHPLVKEIDKLLLAVIAFQSALNVDFIKSNNHFTKDQLLTLLNNIGKALLQGNLILQADKFSPEELEIFSHAMDYAKKCIHYQLQALQGIHHQIYDLYKTEKHELIL